MSVSSDRVVFGTPNIYLYDSTLSAWTKAGDAESFEASVEVETETYKGNYKMPIDAAIKGIKCTGKITGFAPDLAFSAKILGGTLAAGATQELIESKTIDAQAHTITLSQTPSTNGCQRVVNSAGAVLQEVVSTLAQGVSYTRATATLTFHASETGAMIVTYGYSLGASGYKLTGLNGAPAVATAYKLMVTSFVCTDASVSGSQRSGKVTRFIANAAVISGGFGIKMSAEQWAKGGDYSFEAIDVGDGTTAPFEISVA